MLKIKNFSKSYGKSDVKAVDNLNLELKRGEIFGFLGPNGAGKTTTIKAVTGILPYEEGAIEINGIDLKKDPIGAKRSIGYVSDNEILFDSLTGREYIDFIADVYGVSAEERTARADKLVEQFQLKSAYDSRINTYSHGMKQKINVIAALIHNPPLWVLDEPMVGLDPHSAFEMKRLMREHCDKGNTVFFSTHVLEVAEKICDRVGIISGGKLIMAGSMEEIRAARSDASLEEIFLSITDNAEVKSDETNI